MKLSLIIINNFEEYSSIFFKIVVAFYQRTVPTFDYNIYSRNNNGLDYDKKQLK